MRNTEDIARDRSFGLAWDIREGFGEQIAPEDFETHMDALRLAQPDELLAAVMGHIDSFPEPLKSEVAARRPELVGWLGGATTSDVAAALGMEADAFHTWKHELGRAIGALIPLDQLLVAPPGQ